MKVYRAHPTSNVHFDPECEAYARVTKKKAPLEPIEIRDLKGVRFCWECSPEELKHPVKTFHATCEICHYGRPYPCEHNGGVRVVNIDTMIRWGKPERRVNTRWRWPERVLGAHLAPGEIERIEALADRPPMV